MHNQLPQIEAQSTSTKGMQVLAVIIKYPVQNKKIYIKTEAAYYIIRLYTLRTEMAEQ